MRLAKVILVNLLTDMAQGRVDLAFPPVIYLFIIYLFLRNHCLILVLYNLGFTN